MDNSISSYEAHFLVEKNMWTNKIPKSKTFRKINMFHGFLYMTFDLFSVYSNHFSISFLWITHLQLWGPFSGEKICEQIKFPNPRHSEKWTCFMVFFIWPLTFFCLFESFFNFVFMDNSSPAMRPIFRWKKYVNKQNFQIQDIPKN